MEVIFATDCGVIQTLEGKVQYNIGDAIVTGVKGEQWPVPIGRFNQTYIPAFPTAQGENGRYMRTQQYILARQLDGDLEVVLSSGSIISGSKGDWLVQYHEGDQAIINDEIFKITYEQGL